MSDKTGGPAFPIIGGTAEYHYGMSLLDYFAGEAMEAEIIAAPRDYYRMNSNATNLSKHAYNQAEAMLAERARRMK